MPGLDRSGPVGMGPMTGRGAGQCNRQSEDNARMTSDFGRGAGRVCHRPGGFGRVKGRGSGGGHFGRKGFNVADDRELLKLRRERLRRSLEEVESQLGESE